MGIYLKYIERFFVSQNSKHSRIFPADPEIRELFGSTDEEIQQDPEQKEGYPESNPSLRMDFSTAPGT